MRRRTATVRPCLSARWRVYELKAAPPALAARLAWQRTGLQYVSCRGRYVSPLGSKGARAAALPLCHEHEPLLTLAIRVARQCPACEASTCARTTALYMREPATRPMQGTAGRLPVLAVLLLAAHVRGIPLQWESIQPVGLRCVGLCCKLSRVLRACVS